MALEQGKAPRAGRHLQEAARELTRRADTAGAAEALRLAASLELRRGKPDQALRPIRAAERLLRDTVAADEQAPVLDLLARVHSHLGEHAAAIRAAERWRASGARSIASANRRLALAHWAAGDINAAICLLDSIGAHAGPTSGAATLLLMQMLLQIGCPTTVMATVTRMLKGTLPDTQEYQAYLTRGWAALCLGQADLASRSFRRAARQAGELAAPRKELEVAVAAAFVERERARAKGDDLARAESRVERKLAQAGRAGLEHLSIPAATALPQSALHAATPKEAAQCLVAVSRASESLTLVEASLAEIERLRRLDGETGPYGFALLPSLSLE